MDEHPSPSQLRGAALTLLGRRDYTSSELRERLIDKGYPVDAVDEVLAALTADGTINDRRVAATHIRVASQVKGRGRYRIQQELAARGVGRPLAEELLRELPAEDEAAAIVRFLSRKLRDRAPAPEERRRLFQQLLRKGFGADAISKALRHDPDES